MIIKLSHDTTDRQSAVVGESLKRVGLPFSYTQAYGIKAFIIFAAPTADQMAEMGEHDVITDIVDFRKEYPLASRAYKKSDTCFKVGDQAVGGRFFNIIAGPCSVESEEQIFRVASYLQKVGVRFIRGGAYKPRTSPYSFQGLGKEGLKLIRKAADAHGLQVVTEVIDTSLIGEVSEYADVLQVGSRNMQNFHFLKQLGKVDKPVLLKRSMYGTIEEWLMAAEYILSGGNEKVILCERGIRTFDTALRNTMDISAIPLAKLLSHLPVYADPSHGTGRRDLVIPMSMAAVAAGADGLMVEVHPDPQRALSDAHQTIYLEQLDALIRNITPILPVTGKSLNTDTETQNHLNVCVE